MNEISALATADVVVVGGGISGWSTAFELRRRGFHVVVVEQRFAAYGASGRNPGAIWMQLRRRGLELELATAGMRKYEEFLAEYGRTFELRRDGGVLFCETAAQQAALEAYVADRADAGLTVEFLSGPELRKYSDLVPESAMAGVFCAEDGQVDATGFIKALAAQCVNDGVIRFENTAVLSTLRRGDAVIGVRTVRGDIHAAGVVWATGAWATNLRSEGLDLPVGTVRMGHLRTQPVGRRGGVVLHGPRGASTCGALTDLSEYSAADFASPGGDAVGYDDSIAYSEDGGMYVGSTLDGRGSLNPHISVAATHAMTTTLLDRFSTQAHAGVVGLWAGLACETPDHLPVLDRVDGVYVNTGHAWGMASGPICGELMAQMIAGETSPLGEQLRLRRPSLAVGDA
jgi:glycine/D-amino acid oxidase-like deaminating enzyme